MSFGFTSIALGLTAALVWGAGDFNGGVAAKRTSTYSVVIVAHLFSMLMLIGAALILREPIPPLESWLWGGVSGLAAGFGLLLLYTALANGRMSVAAPVSALVAAGIPVIFAAFTQALPPALVIIGFVLALAAIWLVSGGGSAGFRFSDLRLPFISGIAFGFFFITLHLASVESIIYALIAVRIASISSLTTYALITRQQIIPTRESIKPILLSGSLDTLGNIAYALSAQLGRVDVAAVLSSLYPGSTVLLAWFLLKERITRWQMVGILTALAAIVLITV